MAGTPLDLIEAAVSECLEEVVAGHVARIRVVLHADGSCTVQDDGRGVPVGPDSEGRSLLEVVLCRLHHAAPSGVRPVRVRPDLHGGGLQAVNAGSAWLEATVCRDGSEWGLRTERAVPVGPVERRGVSTEQGTRIRFKPQSGTLPTAGEVEARLGSAAARAGARLEITEAADAS
jgi:DNA gyrase/topoisomerase IV subunit B